MIDPDFAIDELRALQRQLWAAVRNSRIHHSAARARYRRQLRTAGRRLNTAATNYAREVLTC